MKSFCLGLFTFIFSLFINTHIVIAEQVDNNEIDNSLDKIENVNENDKSSKRKNSGGDIFGDEQTFPFVAGLGKNAAH